MGLHMSNNKKAVSQKKSNSKFFIPAKVLHRIIVGTVIALFVILVGAYVIAMTDTPAKNSVT